MNPLKAGGSKRGVPVTRSASKVNGTSGYGRKHKAPSPSSSGESGPSVVKRQPATRKGATGTRQQQRDGNNNAPQDDTEDSVKNEPIALVYFEDEDHTYGTGNINPNLGNEENGGIGNDQGDWGNLQLPSSPPPILEITDTWEEGEQGDDPLGDGIQPPDIKSKALARLHTMNPKILTLAKKETMRLQETGKWRRSAKRAPLCWKFLLTVLAIQNK